MRVRHDGYRIDSDNGRNLGGTEQSGCGPRHGEEAQTMYIGIGTLILIIILILLLT